MYTPTTVARALLLVLFVAGRLAAGYAVGLAVRVALVASLAAAILYVNLAVRVARLRDALGGLGR